MSVTSRTAAARPAVLLAHVVGVAAVANDPGPVGVGALAALVAVTAPVWLGAVPAAGRHRQLHRGRPRGARA